MIDAATLIELVEASTKTIEVCVPSRDFYARRGDFNTEHITFIDAQVLVEKLREHVIPPHVIPPQPESPPLKPGDTILMKGQLDPTKDGVYKVQEEGKIPPAGTVPRFGDIVNSRHTYTMYTPGGWQILVDANSKREAIRIAKREGYIPIEVYLEA